MDRFGKQCRILSLLGLTGGFFFVELIVGYFTNSMALVADSFHMLSDEIALLVAYVSVRISPKKWTQNTYGWARAEVLGALANSVFLVALCFTITVEAFGRFMEIKVIKNPQLLLIVGTLGLLINVFGLVLFHEYSGAHQHQSAAHKSSSKAGQENENEPSYEDSDSDDARSVHRVESQDVINMENEVGKVESTDLTTGVKNNEELPRRHRHTHSDPGHMNMRGVFLHVLSDALGSVIVIISALVYWLTNWKYKYYVDPALSIILVLLILNSVWPLLRDSALILLQTIPPHIQVEDIKNRLLTKVEGILGVHEFHIWQLAGDRIIVSAHIRVRNLLEYMKVAAEVKAFFHDEGIHSTTIQPEFIGSFTTTPQIRRTDDCVLVCPPSQSTNCVEFTCCGPIMKKAEEVDPEIVEAESS